ncbi:DMT family transporter [bacterium]|nr:DMT family transporter [bacterium]
MDHPPVSPRLMLLPAVMAVAASSLFIRLADVPPLAAAFWRAAFAGIAFLPFFAIPSVWRQWHHISFRTFLAICGATFIIAIHNILFITSLSYTSVAASTVLTCTQPIFTAFLGAFLIREKISHRAALGLIGTIAGAVLISLPQGGSATLKGNLLAIAAAITVALFVLCARTLRRTAPLVPFQFTVHLASVVYLFLFAQIFTIPLTGFDFNSWKALLLLGLIPTFIGHTLLTYSVGYLKAYLVSLAIVGEPVGATLLAAIFLAEIPSWLTVIGGVIILASILYAVYEKDVIPSAIAN